MDDRLKKSEFDVRDVPLNIAQELVAEHHYAKGGANTGTFTHGLFRKGEYECLGVAWWIPPTRSAAEATYHDWRKVLSLSRLVIIPGVPKNAASFLLGKSVQIIRRTCQWECLVTYADTHQNHSGGIYRASNWEYMGLTAPERIYVDGNGRMVSRKIGPSTRTHDEMIQSGFRVDGKSAKHKFRLILKLNRQPKCLKQAVLL